MLSISPAISFTPAHAKEFKLLVNDFKYRLIDLINHYNYNRGWGRFLGGDHPLIADLKKVVAKYTPMLEKSYTQEAGISFVKQIESTVLAHGDGKVGSLSRWVKVHIEGEFSGLLALLL
jgi:hypothetical protein